MASICSLDIEFADKIDTLLKPPSPHEVQEYFDKLIKTRQCCGIRIKYDGKYGKGVYTETEFAEGSLILKDQMLVGAQHSSNKVDCLVCSYCFCFIGSVELQIGRKLYLQDLGLSASKECVGMYQQTSKGCTLDDSLDGDQSSLMVDHESSGSCISSDQNDKIPLPKDVITSLLNGDLVLPHSDQFPLPSVVPCPGGCGEANYCSKSCADADWELFHSLLCTGERSGSSCREALMKFVQHANETNDIFLPAAKAISFTILNYKKLRAAHLEKHESYGSLNSSEDYGFSLLLEAWKPLSMGYKKKWWDCIALPDDVGSHDESFFRLQIRELAFTSLQLLKEAIFDKECAPLFSLEIYGHIIGMFELNNLDLVVASPVEDYFLHIDDLPNPEKEKTEKITQRFLDALGDDYYVCCQGTAFFPVQSCMNHSCRPNAKAFKREEDRDGQATIIALRPISRGEEITISYIDEELPFEERQVLLADYGFRCRCPKCVEDEP